MTRQRTQCTHHTSPHHVHTVLCEFFFAWIQVFVFSNITSYIATMKGSYRVCSQAKIDNDRYWPKKVLPQERRTSAQRIEGVGGVGVLFSRGRPCSNLHDLLDQTMPGSEPGALRTLHGCRECELGSEGFGSMPERYEWPQGSLKALRVLPRDLAFFLATLIGILWTARESAAPTKRWPFSVGELWKSVLD